MDLLTQEEFHKLHEEFFGKGSCGGAEIDDTDLCFRVAKEQLKKDRKELFAWGDSECPHHKLPGHRRRTCLLCWQSLKEETR